MNKELLGSLVDGLTKAGYLDIVTLQVSATRTDVLIGYPPPAFDPKLRDGYTAPFEADYKAPRAIDVLAKLKLACDGIEPRAPRLLIVNVRPQPKVEAPKG